MGSLVEIAFRLGHAIVTGHRKPRPAHVISQDEYETGREFLPSGVGTNPRTGSGSTDVFGRNGSLIFGANSMSTAGLTASL